MQDNIQTDLEQILRELDQEQQQTRTTNDISHIKANQEYDRELCMYDVEIHIYPREESEPEEPANIVESVPPIEREQDERRPSQRLRAHTLPLAARSLIACSCALVVGCLLYLLPLWTATTTVTLVPVARTIEARLTVTIGSDDKTHSKVPGRVLPTVTMSQVRTVTTTGKAHQEAQNAHGSITFYNNATYAQTIPARTLLTAANGVQVVTDQDVTVSAVNYPTLGQASISAQATQAGPAGNMKAGAIYGPCCRVNISAVNGVFSGGQDARDYQTVTQHDIDAAGTSLQASLDQSTIAALQIQVQSTETLVTPLHCQQKTSTDHQPGEESANVHVTLDETCTGIVYQTQALQTLITQALTSQAKQQLGAAYTPSGEAHITTTTQDTTTMQATGTSVWVYQFSQAEQARIKASIAGKDQTQAKRILLAQAGIQSVSFSNTATLPAVQHIRLMFITY